MGATSGSRTPFGGGKRSRRFWVAIGGAAERGLFSLWLLSGDLYGRDFYCDNISGASVWSDLGSWRRAACSPGAVVAEFFLQGSPGIGVGTLDVKKLNDFYTFFNMWQCKKRKTIYFR